MRDALAIAIKSHLETTGATAVSIERAASFTNGAIASIIAGNRPRPERMARLLQVVDDATAGEWLRAYLMDEVPDEWRHRLRILIEDRTGIVREESPPIASVADQFDKDIAVITERGASDMIVYRLIHDIAELLRGGSQTGVVSFDPPTPRLTDEA